MSKIFEMEIFDGPLSSFYTFCFRALRYIQVRTQKRYIKKDTVEDVIRFFCQNSRSKEMLEFMEDILTMHPEWFSALSPYYATVLSECGEMEKSQSVLAQEEIKRKEMLDSVNMSNVNFRVINTGWTASFGHTALIDYFYKLDKLKMIPDKQTFICVDDANSANAHFVKYWEQYYPILPNYFLNKTELFDQNLSITTLNTGQHVCYGYAAKMAEVEWQKRGLPPALKLFDADIAYGQEQLRKMGIPEGAWYVCVHVREARGKSECCNAKVATYFDAFKLITDKGGYVIRMGDVSMTPLPSLHHTIDYAHSPYKNARMDVFLFGSCNFMVGTSSSPLNVPPCFGIPTLFTNAMLPRLQWYNNMYTIPKLYYDTLSHTPITFFEINKRNLDHIIIPKVLEGNNVFLDDNSSEDICEGVREMLSRMEGTFTQATDYEDIQRQWHGAVALEGRKYPFGGNSPIAYSFAKKYLDRL